MKLSTVAPATVAICIPCRDMIHSIFSYNLIQLVQYSNTLGIKTNVFMNTGSLLPKQRQTLATDAIEKNYSHILWLDSDMSFPVTILETLLSHNTDIIACNYSTRSTPFKGVAYKEIGNWDSWLGFNILGNRIEEVEAIGMGCMLTSTKVYKSLPRPWFEISWSEKYNDYIGEDFYFCNKLREHGYSILVDNILSRQISHIGQTKFDLINTLK